MLTEIEWWGGILFIWMTFCYKILFKQYEGEPKIEIGFLCTTLSFLLAGVVLALYFYPLETKLPQLIYLGAIALGAIAAIVMFFLPDIEPAESESEPQEEHGEAGRTWEIIGHLIFIVPIIVPLGLGASKSRDFFTSIFS